MIIIYDINSCPDDSGLDMEKVVEIFKEHNWLLWDSSNRYGIGSTEPKVVFAPEEEKIEISILDLQDDDVKEKVNKILKK